MLLNKFQVFVLIIVSLLHHIKAANILIMMPMPFFSHTNPLMPIITELAIRKHDITFVSPFPPKTTFPNLHHVQVENILNEILDNSSISSIVTNSIFTANFFLWDTGPKSFDALMKDPVMRNFLSNKQLKFDVIIAEPFFVQEPVLALAHKYQAPVINFAAGEITSWCSYFIGNPNPYSYVPNMGLVATDKLSFNERMLNTISNIFDIFGYFLYYVPKMEKTMKKYFKPEDGFNNLPPLTDLMKNTSITLTDHHYSIGVQRPYHTNVIQIGGITLKTGGTLPPDLLKIMDEAKHGVVYFSFGSYFDPEHLGPEAQRSLLEAFGRLKQTVLAKWITDKVDNLPANVKIFKWLPQPSVLAHKNVKVFISHGGAHGVQEGAANGVPIVGIPVLADQPKNIKFVEEAKFGISIDKFNITADNVFNAIKTILDNPSYKENAVRMSKIIKDRPLEPLQNAIYWIEYVIRHNGALHLRPASVDISWFKYLLLDIVAVIAVGISLIFLVMRWCCRIICCRTKKDQMKSSYKKKKKE